MLNRLGRGPSHLPLPETSIFTPICCKQLLLDLVMLDCKPSGLFFSGTEMPVYADWLSDCSITIVRLMQEKGKEEQRSIEAVLVLVSKNYSRFPLRSLAQTWIKLHACSDLKTRFGVSSFHRSTGAEFRKALIHQPANVFALLKRFAWRLRLLIFDCGFSDLASKVLPSEPCMKLSTEGSRL